MKSKPILIYNAFIDGHRVQMRLKTRFNLLDQLRLLLKEKYNANSVYFNYRERIKIDNDSINNK